MTAIRIEQFGGIAPLVNPRKLPDQGAVIASECKFVGTDLAPLLKHTLSEAIGYACARMFKWRFQGVSHWVYWSQTAYPKGVDVVASPIPADSIGRIYWTTGGQMMSTKQPASGDIGNSASTTRPTGTPQPHNAPTITENQVTAFVSAGGFLITNPIQITAMSATAPVTVTTSLPQPFKDGWTVLFASQSGTDGGMKELDGLEFVVGNCTANSFDLLNTDGTTYTPFVVNKTLCQIKRVYTDSEMETGSYVYTYVTDWGEEGPPSPPSTPAQYRYDSTKNVATTLDSINAGIALVRIYRVVAGTSGANFFFVKEQAVSGSTIPLIVDSVPDTQLGELLPSTTWFAPPLGLQGLVAMPGGFFIAFNGNTLYQSEPYMPHAWPPEYQKTTQDDIVGIAVYGQTLVVATRGKPYLAVGSDPASLSMQQLDLEAPCLSKGGVCAVGTGVLYPTANGLAMVSAMGAQIITLPYFTRQQWVLSWWNNNMTSAFKDGRYIAFSPSPSNKTLIMDNRPDAGVNVSYTSTLGRTAAIDPDDDTLHFAYFTAGSLNDQNYQWEGGPGSTVAADWQSKVFTLPHAVNLSTCRVFAEGYPLTLKLSYANLQANSGQTAGVITDTLPTITVAGSEPFRLPGGYLSREFQVEIITTSSVQSVVLTDNTDDLR